MHVNYLVMSKPDLISVDISYITDAIKFLPVGLLSAQRNST